MDLAKTIVEGHPRLTRSLPLLGSDVEWLARNIRVLFDHFNFRFYFIAHR